MPPGRLELPLPCEKQILNLPRLPIPPRGHGIAETLHSSGTRPTSTAVLHLCPLRENYRRVTGLLSDGGFTSGLGSTTIRGVSNDAYQSQSSGSTGDGLAGNLHADDTAASSLRDAQSSRRRAGIFRRTLPTTTDTQSFVNTGLWTVGIAADGN